MSQIFIKFLFIIVLLRPAISFGEDDICNRTLQKNNISRAPSSVKTHRTQNKNDASTTDAKIILFKDGRPTPDHDNLVKNLKNGDTVVFSDKTEFILGKTLGEGQLTRIFDIGEGKAIRIAKHAGFAYLTSSLTLYRGLAHLKIPTIKTFNKKRPTQTKPLEYLVVEKVSGVTLQQLIAYPESLSQNEFDKAREGLIHFAQKTAHVFFIMDLKPDSLIWDGQNWKILDAMPLINFVYVTKVHHKNEIFYASAIVGNAQTWATAKPYPPFYQNQFDYTDAPPLLFYAMLPNTFVHFFAELIGVDEAFLPTMLTLMQPNSDSTSASSGFLTFDILKKILDVTHLERKKIQASVRI